MAHESLQQPNVMAVIWLFCVTELKTLPKSKILDKALTKPLKVIHQ
jgi:hypothetical protein